MIIEKKRGEGQEQFAPRSPCCPGSVRKSGIEAAPAASGPAGELCAVDHASLPIFERAVASARIAGENAQRLHLARCGIHTESAIAHLESLVGGGDLLQPLGDVDAPVAGTVVGTRDLELVDRTAAPLAATPSGEERTIDQAVFTIFEGAVLASRVATKDAQRLHLARCGIHTECTIAHLESLVGIGDHAQLAGDVDPPVAGAIVGTHDLPLLGGCGRLDAGPGKAATGPAATAPTGEEPAIHCAAFAVFEGAS